MCIPIRELQVLRVGQGLVDRSQLNQSNTKSKSANSRADPRHAGTGRQ